MPVQALWRERLWRRAYADVLEGKPGAIVAAVRVAQVAAPLDGLDSPTRLSLLDPTQEQIDEFLNEALGSRHTDSEPDIFIDAEVIEAEIEE